jgi:uncharacterized membrane protein (UPF0127 family)
MAHELFRITNETRGTLVCDRARIADSFLTRLVGLLGRRFLDPGEGLLITPSSGVHTFGMAFPIDIVALDSRMRINRIREKTGPWRIGGLSLRTKSVLELPAGQSSRARIEIGDQLSIAPAVSVSKNDVD